MLSHDSVQRFKGGQAEIQNQNAAEGYLFRGEIQDIAVVGNVLRIGFAWLAEAEGYPPLPKRWIKCDRPDYEASLEIYAETRIGSDRISLESFIVGEIIVLFPPGGSKLDPAMVEGLNLAPSQ